MRALVGDVRRICGNLRPPTIDSLGLGAALQSYTRDWSARTGLAAADVFYVGNLAGGQVRASPHPPMRRW